MNEPTLGLDLRQQKKCVAAAALYIALVTFSNLGSLRVILLLGLSLDGGALLYPFTFTMRDLLHRVCGARLTRFVIWLSAGLNLGLFAYLWLVGALPPDSAVGSQTEYALVLAPGVRLVLASVLAGTIAELIDTHIYSRVRQKYGRRKLWLRVLASNAVSVPTDTALFLLLAFWGRYTPPVLAAMFLGNLALKYVVSLCSMGVVYLGKDDAE